jgi:hypothetical protein
MEPSRGTRKEAMKIRRIFEGPTAFEWFVIACMVLATMQVMANHRAVLAKAKAAKSQINK